MYKILIVRKGNIGDHICALPALHALKKHFAAAEFHCLTSSGNYRELDISSITGKDFFSTIIHYSDHKRVELLRQIKAGRYDLVIELPQYLDTLYTQLRNMFFFRFAGIPSGFGWQVSNLFVLRKVQLRQRTFQREAQRLLSILQLNGISTGMQEVYNPDLNAEEIASLHLPAGKLVAVAVGAKEPRKRWPLENFKTVIDQLLREGYIICLIGNEADALQVKQWESPRVINLCGRLSPAASLSLLKQCELAITNDSGPMHMTYAVGTPLLVTFSARDYPGKWFPPQSDKTVLLHHYEVPCAVCVGKSCVQHICMEQITPAEVLGHAKRLLKPAAPVHA